MSEAWLPEQVADVLCQECSEVPFDELPLVATYRERKTHPHRMILDKQEALLIAHRVIETVRKFDGARP